MTTETTTPASCDLRIDTYAESSYLQYAMATVKDRALCQVQDGQKPVHRRILFAMRQLGLSPDAKPVKSARIVGDVLGKYHPHGDTSVYDAMVRVAQDFSLRYPLISGQGNFGSRDGDGAAAMRYTEAQLAPIAKLLLDELGTGTVDFVGNYDNTQQEPRLLPARLPFTLLNGTMGIAVALASNIPPHNLREVASAAVATLKNPDITTAEVMALIPGPDFPDGGQVISTPEDLLAVYEKGRGPIRVRARWVKEELARGQWQLIVTELPYQVSTKMILNQLDVLSNPQPPAGKKALTPKQQNLKALALDFLELARDESGKESAVRIVLIPRNSKVDAEAMMAFLVANTSLEDSFGLNMTLLGADGSPGTKGIVTVLKEWGAYRVATVRRRTQFELLQTEKRIHILEGRLTVFLNVDEVVKVIRDAEDPKADLTTRFQLSEAQSEDVLEMRLRALNKLEGFKLEKELGELKKLAARLASLLASEKELKALVIKEIEADATQFGDDRRTLMKQEARAAKGAVAVKTVLEESITIVVSKNLWVRSYKGHGIAEESMAFKAADKLGWKVETSTVNLIAVLDGKGRAYSFSPAEVPTKGEGAPLLTFIELQEGAVPVAILSGSGEQPYMFAGSNGYGFSAPLKGLWARPRAGKTFLTLDDGEQPLAPVLVPTDNTGYVIAVSTDAKLLAFSCAELAVRPSGGKGVVLLDVGEGKLHKLWHSAEPHVEFSAKSETGKPLRVKLSGDEWLKHVGKRARKGAYLPKKSLPL